MAANVQPSSMQSSAGNVHQSPASVRRAYRHLVAQQFAGARAMYDRAKSELIRARKALQAITNAKRRAEREVAREDAAALARAAAPPATPRNHRWASLRMSTGGRAPRRERDWAAERAAAREDIEDALGMLRAAAAAVRRIKALVVRAG